MEQYQKGSANFPRLATDRLFIDFDLRAEFEGSVERAFQFIQREQLMDPALWQRFVQQFRDQIDSEKGAWRGEYWGKMMRGACFVYAHTRSDGLYRMLTATVEDLLSTQAENGRISSFREDAELFGWDLWCRKYVLLGLQYFLEICDDAALCARIIVSMRRQADYLLARIGPGKKHIFETSQVWRGLNSSTVLEPMVRLYSLTGDARYLDFAAYLVREGGTSAGNLIELAAEDRLAPYQYPVTKAYEMMSFFEGVLEYSRVTGNARCKTAAVQFGRRLAETDVTITGGAGCSHELLDCARLRQSEAEGLMQETCVTVTWMKFCCQLLLATGEPLFGDQIETALYNAYLGAINTEKALDQATPQKERFRDMPEYLHFDSYSPLLPGTRGKAVGGLQLMKDGHYYGCCACIGAAGIGLAHKAALLLAKDGAALNLYIPGTLRAELADGTPLRVSLTTAYPADGHVRIAVSPAEETLFTLYLRIPGWCKNAQVTLNEEETVAAKSGWFPLKRRWRAGDVVVLHLAMPTEVLRPIPYGELTIHTDMHWKEDRLDPVTVRESPENALRAAFRRGPLVLAADARTGADPGGTYSPQEENGTVQARLLPPDAIPFPVQIAAAIPLKNGGSLTLVDYASAGKTLNETSRMAAWLKTKRSEPIK